MKEVSRIQSIKFVVLIVGSFLEWSMMYLSLEIGHEQLLDMEWKRIVIEFPYPSDGYLAIAPIH